MKLSGLNVKVVLALSALNILHLIALLIDSLSLEYYFVVHEGFWKEPIRIYLTNFLSTGDFTVQLIIFFWLALNYLALNRFKLDRFTSTYLLALTSILLYFQGIGFPYFLIPLSTSSLILTVKMALNSEEFFNLSKSEVRADLLNYFLTILALIELIALAKWIHFGLFGGEVIEWDWSWVQVKLSDGLLFSLQKITPIIFLVLIYSWVIYPLASKLLSEVKVRRSSIALTENDGGSSKPINYRIVLISAVVISILIPLYPFQPAINPSGRFIGVDMPRYNKAFFELAEVEDFFKAVEKCFYEVMGGERALYFLFLYSIKYVFQISAVDVIRLEPSLLNVLLVASTYFLTLNVFKEKFLASLTALFSAISSFVTGGIYGGFYANWLALTLVLFSIAFILRFFEGRSLMDYFLSILFSILVLLTHPWTWDIYLAILSIYSVVYLTVNRANLKASLKTRLLPIAFLISVNLFTDYVREFILEMFGGVAAVYYVYRTGWIGFHWIQDFWLNLNNLFHFYVGGMFSNPLVLILSLIALIWLYVERSDFSLIIYSWIFFISLFFPFTSLDIHGRLFFMLPLQLIYPLGVFKLMETCSRFNLNPKIIFSTFLLMEVNYAVKCMAHLI